MVLEIIPRLFEYKDEGIVICDIDEQPLKAFSSIEVTDEGISKFCNDEHCSKALSQIAVIEEGIGI